MGKEIHFSSVHPRVELEGHFKFSQASRNEISTFLGVFECDDEAMPKAIFVRIHIQKE